MHAQVQIIVLLTRIQSTGTTAAARKLASGKRLCSQSSTLEGRTQKASVGASEQPVTPEGPTNNTKRTSFHITFLAV
jgi:hypothetical protein